ncbi:MAG TPA: hypothetical protein VMF09_13820 [Solirubrobacteraceae bacterium]|nr:hypothetical protein [Solirubrobacteraceae bacterium]
MATEAASEAPPAAAQATALQPRVAKPPAPAGGAGKAGKGGKAGKDAKAGKKGGKSGKDAGADAAGPSIAAHPRAARAVARAKGWGGLLGFAIAGYTSLPTNTFADAVLRALVAGVICYVAAWAGAVFLWRRLVVLEIKSREQQLVAGSRGAPARRELPPAPPRPGGRRP